MHIPPNDVSEDPWMPRKRGVAAIAAEELPSRAETFDGVTPLDAQIGVFPKKTVPDALYDALFGQSAKVSDREASPASTYAILDAGKITNLPELLGRTRLEHRCLYKGAAFDELKHVAPWIVRLEEDDSFTRRLFTRSPAPWHLWDNEPGIYVRSRETLDEMWRHLRKFTRVQDEDGKWFYFRFWEPRWLSPPSKGMQGLVDRLGILQKVEALVAIGRDGRGALIRPVSMIERGGALKPALSRDDLEIITDQQRDRFNRETADALLDRYSNSAASSGGLACVDWVGEKRRWLSRVGVVARKHVVDHLKIMLHYGNSVIDHPDYRGIMTRPFLSKDEQLIRLRHRFPVDPDVRH